MRSENRRVWLAVLLLVVVLLAAGAAWSLRPEAAPGSATGGSTTGGSNTGTPAEVWAAQEIDHYRYTLQVGCFCIVDVTRPVVIEVKDGQVASITYADDGTAADPALFEAYDSIDKILALISEAEAQEPARLDVTYDEATGVPGSVAIDISQEMADEELYLEISGFEALSG